MKPLHFPLQPLFSKKKLFENKIPQRFLSASTFRSPNTSTQKQNTKKSKRKTSNASSQFLSFRSPNTSLSKPPTPPPSGASNPIIRRPLPPPPLPLPPTLPPFSRNIFPLPPSLSGPVPPPPSPSPFLSPSLLPLLCPPSNPAASSPVSRRASLQNKNNKR